ncbi:MAG TPA: recombinase family protein [Ktedonobacterales bacterium]|nr:recombinase family protein [Ktedonobacterales bacterium]
MRTAIYCRVSTPGQRNTTSLPEQERINREHAAGLGWEVSEPHVYREVEGGEDLYRPHMDRLWDAIQAHEIDAVVIDVLDRLSRDEGDQGAVYHHADRYGVVIELASQDYDESEQGRTLRFIAGLHARMEHADIRRRTQRGRKARVAAGKMLAGAYPLYGYLWGDPDKGQRTYCIIDPETAPIVVRIFTQAATGVPLRKIARDLELGGIPTPGQVLAERGQLPANRTYSAAWRVGTIRRILWHPAYIGEHAAYRRQRHVAKVRPPETGVTVKVRQVIERAEDDPVRVMLPNSCPALVSRELAERVHAHLRENQAESAGRNPDVLETLWRNLQVCGHCGRATRTMAHPWGRRYYCRAHWNRNGARPNPCPGGGYSIRAQELDAAGWADVHAWLENEENVARLLAEWEQETRSTERSLGSRLDAAAATIAHLHSKMDSLAESIAETTNKESRRTLQDKLDRYSEQVAAEEAKRERLVQEAHDEAEQAREAREVREWVRVVAGHMASFTREEQRQTLKVLGAHMTVWRADYVHPDGWPQRYQIKLPFTGFTGQAPITLPAQRDSNYL